MSLGCITGRFQPLHRQHTGLLEIALEACTHVIVAVTNPDTGARHEESTSAHRHTAAANPFTYYERVRLIQAAARENGYGDRITIVPFNMTQPALWPQYVPLHAIQFVRAYSDWERQKAQRFERAGYAVTLLIGDALDRVSAGEVRARLNAGDERWHALVPTATIPLLEGLLACAPLNERR